MRFKSHKELAIETIEFYKQDPSRRSVNEKGHCFYRGANGKKCAIGRKIPDELYRKKMEGNSIYTKPLSFIIETLGYLPYFLSEIQYFHDSRKYWDEKGLSPEGENRAKEIIKMGEKIDKKLSSMRLSENLSVFELEKIIRYKE